MGEREAARAKQLLNRSWKMSQEEGMESQDPRGMTGGDDKSEDLG